MAADGGGILTYVIDEGFLATDGDLASIGPESERRFGARHFSKLMTVFTAAPEFVLLADAGGAARVLLLAGRAWLVTYIDWKRRCCFVEPTDLPGRARRGGLAGGMSFEITRGM